MGQKLKDARDDRKFTELMTDSARQIWLARWDAAIALRDGARQTILREGGEPDLA